MKIKPGFELRKICGENIVISHGMENISFTKVINLNESAAIIWENVIGKNFTIADVTRLLLDNYEVDEPTAEADSASLVREWNEIGIVCF
ncbi:MAG: PqqD family protein [Bacteroidaceae bacterium]|nr:PqqD family protein [Bacteroidaceae bacterium]